MNLSFYLKLSMKVFHIHLIIIKPSSVHSYIFTYLKIIPFQIIINIIHHSKRSVLSIKFISFIKLLYIRNLFSKYFKSLVLNSILFKSYLIPCLFDSLYNLLLTMPPINKFSLSNSQIFHSQIKILSRKK